MACYAAGSSRLGSESVFGGCTKRDRCEGTPAACAVSMLRFRRVRRACCARPRIELFLEGSSSTMLTRTILCLGNGPSFKSAIVLTSDKGVRVGEHGLSTLIGWEDEVICRVQNYSELLMLLSSFQRHSRDIDRHSFVEPKPRKCSPARSRSIASRGSSDPTTSCWCSSTNYRSQDYADIVCI
jgi:hypothetical protein